MSNKRLIFFGNERLATSVKTEVPLFRALIENGYVIAALVIAQGDNSHSRDAEEPEIIQVAIQHNIPIIKPSKMTEICEELAALNAELGVLVAFGKMVPKSIIDLFPCGIINLHPSLLPKHRGPIPLESVMLAGDTETGVSVMQLSKDMDAGPIYAQVKLILSGLETKQELADKLLDLGKGLIIENLPRILDGSLTPQVQDDSMATYDNLITKDQSKLDFNKPALQLEREIRAYAGWPRSRTSLNGVDMIIIQAHVIDGSGAIGNVFTDDKQLGFYTSDGILIIDKLVPSGKKEMDAAAFLTGHQIK
jgi:methionyl-tRNA formyltransferase